MTRPELDAILAEIAAETPPPTDDMAALRRLYDRPDPRYRLPEGVRVEPVATGGVRGEWQVPDGTGDAVVLYFHGGGYCFMSPATHRPMTGELARLAGARVFSLDYRRAPEHAFPAAVDDALAAVHWLYDTGVTCDKLVFAGDSAGGGLALATLIALRDRWERLPAGAIALTPWVDLTMSAATLARYTTDDPKGSADRLRWLAGMYLPRQNGAEPLASPLYANLAGLPPLYILAATRDRLCGEAKALAARARHHGVEVTLGIWDGMIHMWPLHYQRLSEGREALERMAEFVIECTSRDPA